MENIIIYLMSIIMLVSGIGEKDIASKNIYLINDSYKIVNSYEELEKDFISFCENNYDSMSIYDTDELFSDVEILENRIENDSVIVERVVGMVTNRNREGDGIILNTSDTNYNYISYRSVDFEIHNGTIILTYLIYNPNTNYVDDIIERYDYILDREYED